MNRKKLILNGFQFADSIVLMFSLYVAAGMYVVVPEWVLVQNIRPLLLVITIAVALLVVWQILFHYFGLYRQRHTSFISFRLYRCIDLVKATSLGTLLLISATILADVKEITVTFALVFWGVDTFGTLLVRELLIFILRQLRLHGRNLRHLLIIGTNKRAQAFAKRIAEQKELGYSLKGFVDDGWNGDTLPKPENNHLIVSGLRDIGEYLKNNVVDEVVIALPIATLYDEASRIVRLCNEQGVVVHFAPGFDFLNLGSSELTFNTLHDEPIITVIPPPMCGWRLEIKRLIDIVGSILLITLLSPVLIITSVLVKLTSPGPMLFVQERVGLNKRRFRLLKFRTMVIDAEKIQESLEHLNEAGGPVFKIENDPRITPIGKFLRRTSLDELPQFLNVLWGNMSLVGPRPLPIRDYEGFDEDWHRRRFSVRPGITCLWQISGRSSITFERWMELDMEYINRWSLWLDLKILAATIHVVLIQRGAV